MTSALTFRALATLPQPLQTLARAHVAAHPCDDLDDLISELAIATIELAGVASDARRIFARARSRLRRATQDVVHYSASIEDARHDVPHDDEPTPIDRRDIVREIAARQRVTTRRAQQLVKRQVERARLGDLFAGAGGEKS
jgi:ABC-type transporter Mla subunit MlaD